MKLLSADRTCSVVKLSDAAVSTLPLVNQMQPVMEASPFLILDADGIQFSSMLIGEVVNLYLAFQQRWQDHRHSMVLVHVPEKSKQVFRVARLVEKVPIFDDLEQAWKSFSPSAARVEASA